MSTYTTTSNSTATWDYAKMMEAMTKIKDEMAKSPLAKIDYIVASRKGLELVKKALGVAEEKIPPSPLQAFPSYLVGIPLKEYPTEREARTKALELSLIENKKVLFIDDAGNCLDLSEMEFNLPEGVYFGSLGYPWNDDPTRASNNR